MAPRTSVHAALDVDATNAYNVEVDGHFIGTVHTDSHGHGLWIDGCQVEGTSQFDAGKSAREAIRRYVERNGK